MDDLRKRGSGWMEERGGGPCPAMDEKDCNDDECVKSYKRF